MLGVTGNIYCGLQEYSDMGFILHILRRDDSVIDVGANVGSYALLASGVCGAKSMCFEPDPENADFLRRNVELNDLGSLVTVHEVALGDTSGDTGFAAGRGAESHVLAREDNSAKRIRIERLDDIDGARDAVFMKIDVNGFAGKVLDGAERVLSDGNLIAIRCEDQGRDEVVTLGRHGFERASYDPLSRRLSRAQSSDSAYYTLFIRDWDAVQQRIAVAPVRRVLGQSI